MMQDDLMYNTKAGLMGALAGIGDAIDSGTVQYILLRLRCRGRNKVAH